MPLLDGTPGRVSATAVSLIDRDGFAALSTNRVAREAGVSWGVLQHHFHTRRGLLLACLEICLESLLVQLREPSEANSLADFVATEAEFLSTLFDSQSYRVAGAILEQESDMRSTAQQQLATFQRLQQRRWVEGVRGYLPESCPVDVEEYRQLLSHTLIGLARQRQLGALVLAKRQQELISRAVVLGLQTN